MIEEITAPPPRRLATSPADDAPATLPAVLDAPTGKDPLPDPALAEFELAGDPRSELVEVEARDFSRYGFD